MTDSNHEGKIAITVFFERPADGRVYQLAEWVGREDIDNREKMFQFCLARWGAFGNPHAVRFIMVIEGHVKVRASNELLRQYLEKAMGPDAAHGQQAA